MQKTMNEESIWHHVIEASIVDGPTEKVSCEEMAIKSGKAAGSSINVRR